MVRLSTAAIAAANDVDGSTVCKWIRDGVALPDGRRLRLGATRTGGRWRSSPEQLQAFLAELTAAHAPLGLVPAGAPA